MDLKHKKRIAAAALASAATVVPAVAGAEGVKGGAYDFTAPVVAIEDIRLFIKTQQVQSASRDAAMVKEQDACYSGKTTTAGAQGQPLAKAQVIEAKKGNKYAGKSMQDLMKDAVAIEKMPYSTTEERIAKDKERAEIQDALREQVTRTAGAQPQAQPSTYTAPAVKDSSKNGSAIAQATNRQMQAATNPAVAQCLATTSAKYEDKSTPMQIVYEDSMFEMAGKMLDSSSGNASRVAHVELNNGSRFNVVKRTGPYGVRAMPLEEAMKAASRASAVAPEFEGNGQQYGTRPGGDKTQAELVLEALERVRKAAEAAKPQHTR